jgi:hypothetical protein
MVRSRPQCAQGGTGSPHNKWPCIRQVCPIWRCTSRITSLLMKLKDHHSLTDGFSSCNLLFCVAVHSSYQEDKTVWWRWAWKSEPRPCSDTKIPWEAASLAAASVPSSLTGLYGQVPSKTQQTSPPYRCLRFVAESKHWPGNRVCSYEDSGGHSGNLCRAGDSVKDDKYTAELGAGQRVLL